NYNKECKNWAEIKIPYAKKHLCREHFLKFIEDRVERTIYNYRLITKWDKKVLLALSGGKDSQVMAYILNKIIKNSEFYKDHNIQLEALYIDLGISPDNYSNRSLEYVRKLCIENDIALHVIPIKTLLGLTIDDIYEIHQNFYKIIRMQSSHSSGGRHKYKKRKPRGTCSYCGLVKRYTINYFAYTNNYSKVATGHNLTDTASTIISNFLNVDIELLSRMGPILDNEIEGFTTKIKPLFFIYESFIRIYAEWAKVPYYSGKCGYSKEAPMVQLKDWFLEYERQRPGIMLSLTKNYLKKLKNIFYEHVPHEKKEAKKCSICGMPTYREVCSFCKSKKLLLDDYEKLNQLKQKSLGSSTNI
ncbi:MAG: hypothetical protein ACTSXF_06895, partial [Promethearchaeota archaeon]